MTKDEIGKLTLSAIRSDNTLRAIGTSQLGGPAGLMAEPVARLLEERERLLEALKGLLYTTVLREEDAPIMGPGMHAARAAIAFAKSPAK